MRFYAAISLLLLLTAMQGCGRLAQSASVAPSGATAVATRSPAAATKGAAAVLPVPAPPATPAPWLLAFQGKDMNELANDKRFPAFLRAHVSNRPLQYWGSDGRASKPAEDAREFLGGPPDDIHIAENRYLTGDACVAHDCPDRGLLWVDTRTGATVFGASVYGTPTPILANRAHLWLFSNIPLTAATLPPTLTDAIAQWSAPAAGGDADNPVLTEITLVQPDGAQVKLQPTDVHAWQPHRSTTAGPS